MGVIHAGILLDTTQDLGWLSREQREALSQQNSPAGGPVTGNEGAASSLDRSLSGGSNGAAGGGGDGMGGANAGGGGGDDGHGRGSGGGMGARSRGARSGGAHA